MTIVAVLALIALLLVIAYLVSQPRYQWMLHASLLLLSVAMLLLGVGFVGKISL
jgi:hypothetical protein